MHRRESARTQRVAAHATHKLRRCRPRCGARLIPFRHASSHLGSPCLGSRLASTRLALLGLSPRLTSPCFASLCHSPRLVSRHALPCLALVLLGSLSPHLSQPYTLPSQLSPSLTPTTPPLRPLPLSHAALKVMARAGARASCYVFAGCGFALLHVYACLSLSLSLALCVFVTTTLVSACRHMFPASVLFPPPRPTHPFCTPLAAL